MRACEFLRLNLFVFICLLCTLCFVRLYAEIRFYAPIFLNNNAKIECQKTCTHPMCSLFEWFFSIIKWTKWIVGAKCIHNCWNCWNGIIPVLSTIFSTLIMNRMTNQHQDGNIVHLCYKYSRHMHFTMIIIVTTSAKSIASNICMTFSQNDGLITLYCNSRDDKHLLKPYECRAQIFEQWMLTSTSIYIISFFHVVLRVVYTFFLPLLHPYIYK